MHIDHVIVMRQSCDFPYTQEITESIKTSMADFVIHLLLRMFEPHTAKSHLHVAEYSKYVKYTVHVQHTCVTYACMYIVYMCMYMHWKLFNQDTLGTKVNVLISKLS